MKSFKFLSVVVLLSMASQAFGMFRAGSKLVGRFGTKLTTVAGAAVLTSAQEQELNSLLAEMKKNIEQLRAEQEKKWALQAEVRSLVDKAVQQDTEKRAKSMFKTLTLREALCPSVVHVKCSRLAKLTNQNPLNCLKLEKQEMNRLYVSAKQRDGVPLVTKNENWLRLQFERFVNNESTNKLENYLDSEGL